MKKGPGEKRLRNTTLKEKLWTLDHITQATPRTIFVSYTPNFSSKPLMIVTSSPKSGQFFLSCSTNLLFGLVGPKPNPVLGSKPKLVLTIGVVCGKSLICFEGDFGSALEMEESGSHQPTISPYQDNVNPHQAESGGSQHNNSVVNPQQMGDHEGSTYTTHTNKSQS